MVTEIMRGFYFPTKMIDADRESIVMKICNTIDVNSNACDTVACCHTHWHKEKLFLIIRLVCQCYAIGKLRFVHCKVKNVLNITKFSF